jgi:hypothetical protein
VVITLLNVFLYSYLTDDISCLVDQGLAGGHLGLDKDKHALPTDHKDLPAHTSSAFGYVFHACAMKASKWQQNDESA